MWKKAIIMLLFIFPLAQSVEEADCGNTNLNATDAPVLEWKIPKGPMNPSQVCKYIINGEPEKLIKLTFKSFVISGAKTACEKASVNIDGFLDNVKTEVASICDGGSERTLYSTGSKMVVTINAIKTVPKESFTAAYESVVNFCGKQKLLAESNRATEWTAGNSLEGARCVYVIKAQAKEVVELTFKTITGSNAQKQTQCLNPIITLENFAEGEKTKIADICSGPQETMVYKSTGEEMVVTIYGTSKEKEAVFTAEYKSVNNPACGSGIQEASEQENSFDVYTGQDKIPANHQCTWEIPAPKDKEVEIYLKEEQDSTNKQCVEVTKPNEDAPVQLCLKTDLMKTTTIQPVIIKYSGPQDKETNKNFKVYYKLSSAMQIQLGMATSMFTILWILSNF